MDVHRPRAAGWVFADAWKFGGMCLGGILIMDGDLGAEVSCDRINLYIVRCVECEGGIVGMGILQSVEGMGA
jgi:hypothetical protein